AVEPRTEVEQQERHERHDPTHADAPAAIVTGLEDVEVEHRREHGADHQCLTHERTLLQAPNDLVEAKTKNRSHAEHAVVPEQHVPSVDVLGLTQRVDTGALIAKEVVRKVFELAVAVGGSD